MQEPVLQPCDWPRDCVLPDGDRLTGIVISNPGAVIALSQCLSQCVPGGSFRPLSKKPQTG